MAGIEARFSQKSAVNWVRSRLEVGVGALLALVALCSCAVILAAIPASASAAPALVAQSIGAFRSSDSTTRERAYSGAKYIGATRVRDIVELKAGFSWTATDNFVANTTAQGLAPYLTVTYQPFENAQAPGSPKPIQPTTADFGAFCSSTASRYGSSVNDYGVFNEPNTYNWPWYDSGGKEEVHPVRAVDYGALYRACYTAIKAKNPSARVYIGELANGPSTVSPCDYLSNAVAAASTKSDGVGVHPYQLNADPNTILPGSTCRGIGRIMEWPSLLAAMKNLRTVGGTAVPLAITEFGYCASATHNPCSGGGAPADEATRASWMGTVLNLATLAGATLFAQYHLVSSDPVGWDTGIMGTDGAVRQQMNTLRSASGATWGAPGVTTGAVVQGGVSSATVSGQVDSHGFTGTTYRFEYGTNPSGEGSTTGSQDAGAGTVAATFNVAIGGLASDTQYYYRIVATGPGGTSAGSVQTFQTKSSRVAYTSSTNKLGIYNPLTGASGIQEVAVRPGTSPSVGARPGGGYDVAYQGADTYLRIYNSNTGTTTNTGYGMAASSPSLVELPGGGYVVAFKANTNVLWTYNSSGVPINTGKTMAANTSPSIGALAGGGYEVAYQTPATWLEIYNSNTGTSANPGYGMATGTSPSVAELPGGGSVVAFKANTNVLWTYNSSGVPINTGKAMAANTSPSIGARPGGGYDVAYQTPATWLEIYDSNTGTSANPGLGMATGTSPSLAELLTGGYKVAFTANTNGLWTYSSASGGSNTGLSAAAGTSPSLTG